MLNLSKWSVIRGGRVVIMDLQSSLPRHLFETLAVWGTEVPCGQGRVILSDTASEALNPVVRGRRQMSSNHNYFTVKYRLCQIFEIFLITSYTVAVIN